MNDVPALSQTQAKPSSQRTMWLDAVRSFSRNRLAITGLVIVVILIICAVFANILAPYPYYQSNWQKTHSSPAGTI